MSVQTAQLKVALSTPLHQLLSQRSQKYGLTMAAYVRNLIIDDVKSENDIPVYRASKKIEALEVDDVDVYFNKK